MDLKSKARGIKRKITHAASSRKSGVISKVKWAIVTYEKSWQFAGNKTSRSLCPKCDRKACMNCLAGQNGHFQSQIFVSEPQSLFFVQPNDPSVYCDHFMGLIPLFVLLPANLSVKRMKGQFPKELWCGVGGEVKP